MTAPAWITVIAYLTLVAGVTTAQGYSFVVHQELPLPLLLAGVGVVALSFVLARLPWLQ